MITEIPSPEFHWFRGWIEGEEALPPSGATRQVVILHPGTRWAPDRASSSLLPYENDPNDAPPSEHQQLIIDEAVQSVVGSEAACHFALYAGYLDEGSRGLSNGFDEPDATWHIGRLNYVLFSGELHECVFAGVDRRWAWGRPYVEGAAFPIVELSYFWTGDHSVFVASPPDTAATFVRGPDALVDRLLEVPEIDAHEWSPVDTR